MSCPKCKYGILLTNEKHNVAGIDCVISETQLAFRGMNCNKCGYHIPGPITASQLAEPQDSQ